MTKDRQRIGRRLPYSGGSTVTRGELDLRRRCRRRCPDQCSPIDPTHQQRAHECETRPCSESHPARDSLVEVSEPHWTTSPSDLQASDWCHIPTSCLV